MTDFADCLGCFLHALQQGAPLGAGDAAPPQPLLQQPPHPLALLQAGFAHTQHSCQQPQEALATHCLRHPTVQTATSEEAGSGHAQATLQCKPTAYTGTEGKPVDHSALHQRGRSSSTVVNLTP